MKITLLKHTELTADSNPYLFRGAWLVQWVEHAT